MSMRAIDTDHNFVKNHDMQQGYEHWDDVSNPGGVGIRDDRWGDEMVSIMTLTNAAAVRQMMIVPIEQQADARYHLRFLYENTYPSSAGQVVVNKKGSTEKLDIELPAKTGLDNADPLTVDLLERQVELPETLGLQAGDELVINLISPKKIAGDGASAEIRLTGFFLNLHLPALVLDAVVIDDRHFVSGSVFPVCLGATGNQRHTLGFEVKPVSLWHDASLWFVDNPLDAITSEPVMGKSQPIDRPWWLDCPDLPGDEPRELEAMIYSKYSAPPCPLRVSWGHHRLELIALKEAQTYPVIEYAQSVELQVQVRSFYTQAPVAREVCWSTGDEKNTILHRVSTDALGRASFQYTPTDANVSKITASVTSLLSEKGEATLTFKVRAFDIDPFKTLRARFDNGSPVIWGEKPRYPERGEPFLVNLDIPADHPLNDADFSLVWGEGDLPTDLGASCQPAFGDPAAVAGNTVLWTANFEDKRDGFFHWVLGCSRLQHASPGNALSLAYNRVQIGKTWGPNKSPVKDEDDVVTCMVQVQRHDGQPVSNVDVGFETPTGTVRSLTGMNGWASVDHQPDIASDYVITARVQRHEGAPVAEHLFTVKALPTSAWKDQVVFSLDEKPLDRALLGVICRRGRTYRLRIDAVAGSGFINQLIALDWGPQVDPLPGFTMNPLPGVTRSMDASGLEWIIGSGTDNSGLSSLMFTSSHVPETREFPLRLLGDNLATETRVMLDHVSAVPGTDTLYPCLWASHQCALMPYGVSALHGLAVKTAIAPMPSGLEIVPPLTIDIVMTAGGARRELNFADSSEDAEMTLTETVMIGDEQLTARTQLKLGHNKIKVVAARGPAIDPILDKGQRARVQARFYSAFENRPVESAQVGWKVGSADPVNSPTGSNGWSVYDAPAQTAPTSDVCATVLNLYDQTTAEQHFKLKTLSTDPWTSLRLTTASSDQLWAQRALFPRRGESFSFCLRADDNNPLLHQTLAVGLSHPDPSELELEFVEQLGEFRDWTSEGLECSFSAGDVKDGSVSVRLAASRLLELSPPQPMSLGSHAIAANITASSGVLQIVQWGEPVVCELGVTSALTGRAMANAQVKWERGEHEPVVTNTGFRGSTWFSFIPDFPGPGAVRASVVGGADSAYVDFHYSMNEPRSIDAFSSDVSEGSPGQPVKAQILVVSARSGKPLQNVGVEWAFPHLSIPASRTDAAGIAIAEFRLPGINRAVLRATVTGGLVGWVSKQLEFKGVPNVQGNR